MKKIEILDEKHNIIGNAEFETFIQPVEEKIQVQTLKFQSILDSMDLGLEILKPIDDNITDFVYISPANYITKISRVKHDQIVGRRFSKLYPQAVESGLLNIMQEVYKTNQKRQVTVNYFKNEKIYDSFSLTIINSQNRLNMVVSKESDETLLYEKDNLEFENSLQGIAILQDGITVKCNKAHAELLGTTPDVLIGRIFDSQKTLAEGVPTEEIDVIINSVAMKKIYYHDTIVRIRRDDGGFSFFRCVLTPITYNNRPATRVTSVNITERKKLEQDALILRHNLSKVQGMTKVAIENWTPENQFNWTSEIYEILEINPDDFNPSDDLIHLHAIEDNIDLKTLAEKASPNKPEYTHLVKVKTGKGNIKYLYMANVCEFNKKDKVCNVYGFVQDVTKETLYQMELNETNEKLQDSLNSNRFLLKEVHHRVKNNLQIILSLLNLDVRYNKKNPEVVIESTRNRINSMALIHELAYKSDDFSCNVLDYLHSQLNILFQSYHVNNINVNYDVEDMELDIDILIPLGLIINELVNNVIKHAFPNNVKGEINISLKQLSDSENYELIFSDNGKGLPEGMDILKSSTLGMTIIKGLTNQIEGKISVIESIHGLTYKLVF